MKQLLMYTYVRMYIRGQGTYVRSHKLELFSDIKKKSEFDYKLQMRLCTKRDSPVRRIRTNHKSDLHVKACIVCKKKLSS